MMGEKKQQSLEEKIGNIEKMIRRMEAPEISLEESFQLYQAGIEQLKACNQMLDDVEKKMQMLNKNGELVDF